MGLIDGSIKDMLEERDIVADCLNAFLYKGVPVLTADRIRETPNEFRVRALDLSKKLKKNFYVTKTLDKLYSVLLPNGVSLNINLEVQDYVDLGIFTRANLQTALIDHASQQRKLKEACKRIFPHDPGNPQMLKFFQFCHKRHFPHPSIPLSLKDIQISPTISIIWYIGKGIWDFPLTHGDTYDVDNEKEIFMPSSCNKLIDSYFIDDDVINKMTTDVKYFFWACKKRGEKGNYQSLFSLMTMCTIRHSVALAICDLLGVKPIFDKLPEKNDKEINMDKVWRAIQKDLVKDFRRKVARKLKKANREKEEASKAAEEERKAAEEASKAAEEASKAAEEASKAAEEASKAAEEASKAAEEERKEKEKALATIRTTVINAIRSNFSLGLIENLTGLSKEMIQRITQEEGLAFQ